MSLSFAAVGLLALGVLGLGPVLAHLARQTPVDRKAFGAMMLVERLVRRLRRQRRIRDPWLLLLRILAVLAVVAGDLGTQCGIVRSKNTYGRLVAPEDSREKGCREKSCSEILI